MARSPRILLALVLPAAICLGTVSAWGGGALTAPPRGFGPQVKMLMQGAHGDQAQSGQRVVASRKQMDKLLTRLKVGSRQKALAEQVDFNRDLVLAIYGGEAPSSGYRVEAARVIEKDGEVQVVIRRLRPGPHCVTLSVMTNPYALAAIPRTDKKLTFITVEEEVDCR
jgi:hypothetical protein